MLSHFMLMADLRQGSRELKKKLQVKNVEGGRGGGRAEGITINY